LKNVLSNQRNLKEQPYHFLSTYYWFLHRNKDINLEECKIFREQIVKNQFFDRSFITQRIAINSVGDSG
jgi:hypothetical protein